MVKSIKLNFAQDLLPKNEKYENGILVMDYFTCTILKMADKS